MYFAKNIVSKMSQYRERIYNIFGTEVLSTEIKNGLNDNEVLNLLTPDEIEQIFDKQAFLNNIDEIYSRIL